ncbi:MAG TPA: alpha/beta hydrolase [Candidatus Limnocylindria bacterium]|nr:alpha/beta hydrolase [Candidatus Limnocylindria bacterium]
MTGGTRRSILRRPAVPLLAAIAGLAIGVTIDVARGGGLETWLARRGMVFGYEARGTVVDIGGRGIYLDCRGAGEPTVILEGGFGSGASGWGATLDGIAAFTRVCAWDRPGIGRSAPRGLHSAADTAADLRAALNAAGERGPFVVVAHSFGGVYARVLSDGPVIDGEPDSTSDGVLAFVMIDTYEPDIGVADDLALPEDIRASIAESLDETAAMLQAGESLDWVTLLKELRLGGPVEQQTLLLTVDPYLRYHDPDPARRDAMVAAWHRGIAARYPNGDLEIVPNTGHMIHLERPNLVIERVREVVLSMRSLASPG